MNIEEMKKKAIEILKVSEKEINFKIIDDNTLYFYQSNRGGNSIIISNDGSYLGASSGISFEKHLEEFKKGRRN